MSRFFSGALSEKFTVKTIVHVPELYKKRGYFDYGIMFWFPFISTSCHYSVTFILYFFSGSDQPNCRCIHTTKTSRIKLLIKKKKKKKKWSKLHTLRSLVEHEFIPTGHQYPVIHLLSLQASCSSMSLHVVMHFCPDKFYCGC